ncbi:hypothetical protein EW146_g5050 [Bondarzewia mesenterica]|uniref:SHSP domain-containing protein n=1 Tax=Bondarzewia mesenterica TaxID=1095465 RepID=A0A4S4LUQ6_9AGAM|nr:hypothetical protein EW146_g5050 [Bondarzewia mesenterica]
MSLTRLFYEPFYSLSDFDRLFNEAFNARALDNRVQRGGKSTQSNIASNSFRPKMDVHEGKGTNTVTAAFELPGLKKEDVQIDVHNNRLTVAGESKADSERKEEGYAVRERRYGRFSRTLPLPEGIKTEEIKASMDNGVLTVTFPKSSPESVPKKITISFLSHIGSLAEVSQALQPTSKIAFPDVHEPWQPALLSSSTSVFEDSDDAFTTVTNIPYTSYTSHIVPTRALRFSSSLLDLRIPSELVLSKSGQALFLGLELATDQLRASIVDENLELVGVEAVDFDSELPEYQTQGGIFTTPGDAYTTPVDMWVKALDFLLEKVSRTYDVGRIKSVGGAAQPALVWWKSTPISNFPSLDSRLPLHSQLSPNSFSLPNTPVAQDTFSHTHALNLEAALGGPDHMAARVGTSAHASLVAAQLVRVREASPDIWARTGRIQIASAFLASLISGAWVGMCEAEACATGIWRYATGGQGQWDDEVLDFIAGGSRDEARRVRGWLGDVDISGGGRRIANVSRYLVERYGFEPDTLVTSFAPDYLSTYLSLCPSPSDAVLSFGPMDFLLTSAPHYLPTRLYNVFPHPAQDPNEKRRYIVMLTSRNADVPRALVRDMYTKSWSAFDRLVSVVPPGGSIGLDDKLFSFWLLQGDSYPLSHVKGIFRFETGIKVNEFRDLRANPRCLVESQIISFRVRWSRMVATGVLGGVTGRSRGSNFMAAATSSTASPGPGGSQSGRTSTPIAPAAATAIGLSFDPYDYQSLPARILTTGAAINFPSVAALVGDVFNAPVFIPTTQLDSAQVVPHRNAPATGFPARASLGGAYVARWVWGKERGTGVGRGSFEEEVRRLLGKRWVASGGVPLRTNVNASLVGSTPAVGAAGSGTSTPYGHGHTLRTGFGSAVFAEEDEDALEELERMGMAESAGFGGGLVGQFDEVGRTRTSTAGTNTTSTSSTTSAQQPSTAYTTPDLSAAVSGATTGENGSVSTAPAALTPVVALPTSEAEMQVGLGKVAEADVDAFMAYAAIVPEYCRLEGMLVKALV